jgi:hypothetical protein
MFEVGDFVVKNPDNWTVTEFDGWGRGIGIGQVKSIEYIDSGDVDVEWPGGRCFENVNEILLWKLDFHDLIKRPIIRDDQAHEVFNKMTDLEIAYWRIKNRRNATGVEEMVKEIDFGILYDVFKMNYPELIVRNNPIDFFNY